jgi:hypothetical protein
LLQVHEGESGGSHNNHNEELSPFNNDEVSTRWKEIYQKIWVDPNMDEKKE